MGTFVYVDGFNYYYRVFKNNRRHPPVPARLKWVNIEALAKLICPNPTIDWIGYFTAFVKPSRFDPDQHLRQRAYISALETIPCVEVVKGNFQAVVRSGTLAGQPNTRAQIDTFEEKGSDVNLATRLVWDAAQGNFDEALVISNDSDLREAIAIATQRAGRIVHVASPDKTISAALQGVASSFQVINVKQLAGCQLPNKVVGPTGAVFERPAKWR